MLAPITLRSHACKEICELTGFAERAYDVTLPYHET